MGFGGGGSGSFVLPNHDHTNVLADGGELLEATTLIDGVTMKAWIDAEMLAASTGRLELLHTYEAGSAEATTTWTPSATVATNKYSKYIVDYSMEATAAFNLQMKINGLGAALYNYSGFTGALGTWTDASTSEWDITTIPAGAHHQLTGTSVIYFPQGGVQDRPQIITDAYGNSVGFQKGFGVLNSDLSAGITSMEIKTSTSTWKTGCKINICGVLAT